MPSESEPVGESAACAGGWIAQLAALATATLACMLPPRASSVRRASFPRGAVRQAIAVAACEPAGGRLTRTARPLPLARRSDKTP